MPQSGYRHIGDILREAFCSVDELRRISQHELTQVKRYLEYTAMVEDSFCAFVTPARSPQQDVSKRCSSTIEALIQQSLPCIQLGHRHNNWPLVLVVLAQAGLCPDAIRSFQHHLILSVAQSRCPHLRIIGLSLARFAEPDVLCRIEEENQTTGDGQVLCSRADRRSAPRKKMFARIVVQADGA